MNKNNKNNNYQNSGTPSPFKIKKPSGSEKIVDVKNDGYDLKLPKGLNDIMNSKNLNNDKLIDPKKIMNHRLDKQ